MSISEQIERERSSEEEDTLARSTKKYKDHHPSPSCRAHSKGETFGLGFSSYRDRLVGAIPGAYEQAFGFASSVHGDGEMDEDATELREGSPTPTMPSDEANTSVVSEKMSIAGEGEHVGQRDGKRKAQIPIAKVAPNTAPTTFGTHNKGKGNLVSSNAKVSIKLSTTNLIVTDSLVFTAKPTSNFIEPNFSFGNVSDRGILGDFPPKQGNSNRQRDHKRDPGRSNLNLGLVQSRDDGSWAEPFSTHGDKLEDGFLDQSDPTWPLTLNPWWYFLTDLPRLPPLGATTSAWSAPQSPMLLSESSLTELEVGLLSTEIAQRRILLETPIECAVMGNLFR
ncbi:hypothetical protein FCV25MIE_02511 [Fagus crenata]